MRLIDIGDAVAGAPAREAELAELWNVAFGKPRLTPMWRLDPERAAHTFVALRNDRIVGAVVAIPSRIVTGPGSCEVVGIGNVATHPDFRGQRIVSGLMADAARWGAARGAQWGVLFTGTPEVYRGQGWQTFKTRYLLGNLGQLRPHADGHRARDNFDYSTIRELHETNYRIAPLTTKRSTWHWDRAAAWYADAEKWLSGDHRPEAYLIVRRDTDRVRLWEAGGALERVRALVGAALADEPDGRMVEARFTDVTTLRRLLGRHLSGAQAQTDATGMVTALTASTARWHEIADHPRAHHLYGDYF